MAIDVPIDNDLLRVISAASDRPVAFTTHPEQLTGGYWATIYGFELERGGDGDDRFAGPLVLRVMPEASVAGKETIVQTALGDAGYATPRVVLSGHDEPLGGAFMVMARAPGNSPMSGLSIGPSPVRLIRSLRRIPVLLGETAARLIRIQSMQPCAMPVSSWRHSATRRIGATSALRWPPRRSGSARSCAGSTNTNPPCHAASSATETYTR